MNQEQFFNLFSPNKFVKTFKLGSFILIMKIAVFTDTFLPNIDGVVTSILNLVKGLSDRGHKIFIICPKYSKMKEEFSYKNIEVIRVSGIPALFYPNYKLTGFLSTDLIKKFKSEDIDIIHFMTPLTLGLEAIFISKILKIPLVGTFHTFFGDPNYLKHVKMDYKFFENIVWRYSKFFYNKCDLITCPSETTKQELILHKHTKLIKVISNGIDFSVFDNSKSKKVKNKYNKNGFLLLFIGRIAYEKNILYLLECFKNVTNKISNVKLILIGEGPEMKEVKEKLKELKIEDKVILLGRVNHDELVKSSIFGACDIFVSASVTENQPMTVLEAQANGLPCVVMNERGMKTLVKNNFNGLLVENNNQAAFSDAIIYLLKNKTVLSKFRKNTLSEIKKHEVSKVIEIWEKTYKSLI
jgi:1,2-diacylglycerol 3-alpha-glucosyltransferase